MNKIRIRVIVSVLALTCFLVIGCGNKEASAKENTTYKITWSEKGNDQELTFTPNDCKRYVTYGVDSIVFYFDNDSEIKRINIQNATCTIVMKDKTITIISGDFVIEPIEGE